MSFNVFPGTESPNNLFTAFSGNYISFIIFRPDNNFSKANHILLEPECSEREALAVSLLRFLLKKLLGLFQVKHYQVYYLERSKAFFQWLWDVSIWWFLWQFFYVLLYIKWLSVFHSGKSELWPSVAAMTVSASRQRPGHGLRSQLGSSEERVRNFCAAFLKLLPLFSWPWPWSKLSEIKGKTQVYFSRLKL